MYCLFGATPYAPKTPIETPLLDPLGTFVSNPLRLSQMPLANFPVVQGVPMGIEAPGRRELVRQRRQANRSQSVV